MTHSMLSFERFHTMFKKLSKGYRNTWSSLEHHYSMMWSGNIWRAPSHDGHQLILHPFNSTITGKADIEYNGPASKIIIHTGGLVLGKLDNGQGGDLYKVQQLWASSHQPLSALLTRFQRDTHGNMMDPMEAPEWLPRRGNLSDAERHLRTMGRSVSYMKGATVLLRCIYIAYVITSHLKLIQLIE